MQRLRRGHVLIAVALTALAVLAVLAVVRTRSETAAATQQANRFNTNAQTTHPPIGNTGAARVVTVIGDNLSSEAQLGTPTTPWTVIAERDLGARIISLSSPGAGYTNHSSNASFGGTFLARAQQVEPRSRAVVFFGGANDEEVSVSALKRASSASISAARTVAPTARIIVIGPVWPDKVPPARLLKVRDALHEVADSAGVVWVDPIAEQWLTGSDVIRSDNATLLARGEQEVARRVETKLEPVLD